jgi:hypothetical protein
MADLDPHLWELPFSRKRALWIEGKFMNGYYQDVDLWGRLDKFTDSQCFLVDAEKAANVLKLIARYSSSP